ncbi:MAG: cell wall-binding repeat-containing protein [Oscillospiraceae bacterium]|nr:cell wall-binding repeat-containing protein [Oscillospiraceae bacterium]
MFKKLFVFLLAALLICTCSPAAFAQTEGESGLSFAQAAEILRSGGLLSAQTEELLAEQHTDLSLLKDEAAVKLLEGYAEYRNASLTGAQVQGSYPQAIVYDEAKRSKAIKEAFAQVESEVIAAKTSFTLRELSEASNGLKAQVYEWVFYIYKSGESYDVSGYGVEHSILLKKASKGWELAEDAYAEDLFDNLKSSSYNEKGEDIQGIVDSSLEPDVNSAPLKGPSLVAPAAYSRTAVAAYADKYAIKYNTAYSNYNPWGGDCANFVSQCIYAGGLKQDNDWNWYAPGKYTIAWVGATSQRKYMARYGTTVVNPANSKLMPGNPVFYGYVANTDKYAHAAICVGFNSAGTPVVNAHNNDRYHVDWRLGTAWARRSTVLLRDTAFPAASAAINGSIVTLSWVGDSTVKSYNIRIAQGTLAKGEVKITKSGITANQVKTLLPQGTYEAYVEAVGSDFSIIGAPIQFKVTAGTNPLSADIEGIVMPAGTTKKINLASIPAQYTAIENVVWSSSSAAVAAVDSNGNVTAKAAGKSLITVQLGGFKYTFGIAVRKQGSMTEPVPVYRLAGSNRYKTAIDICDEFWKTANTVVIASGQNYADALAGVPLAYELDAPILLTGGSQLESEVAAQIKKLKASNIIVLGGTASISNTVFNELKKLAPVDRISGESRLDTSVRIAERLDEARGTKSELAAIVTGFNYADALSAGPYAAVQSMPIIYIDSRTEELSQEVEEYLQDINEIYIIGGFSSVPLSTELLLGEKTLHRLSGDNRYSTSLAVAVEFKDSMGEDVMFATGTNFPDALSGGAAAARQKTHLLLANNNAMPAAVNSFLKELNVKKIHILGGSSVIYAPAITDLFV